MCGGRQQQSREDDPVEGGQGGVAPGDSNPGLSKLNALITETQAGHVGEVMNRKLSSPPPNFTKKA